MIITQQDIGWASYESYEGPIYRGHKDTKFVPVGNTLEDRFIHVITSVESGNYSAINMYDSGIVSVGLFQFKESKLFFVSEILGLIAKKYGVEKVKKYLNPALIASNADFKMNSKGKWRFFFDKDNTEVITLEQQHHLFWHCNGRKGSWDEVSKEYAKLWCACFANLFLDKECQTIQLEYSKKNLCSFVFADAKRILFNEQIDMSKIESIKYYNAAQSMYLMYAINLPGKLNEVIKVYDQKTDKTKYSIDWCIDLIREMTFAPNVKIYPIRYNKACSIVERHFDIILPPNADQLKVYKHKVEEIKEDVKEQNEVIQLEPTVIEIDELQEEKQRKDSDTKLIAIYGKDNNQSLIIMIINFVKRLLGL